MLVVDASIGRVSNKAVARVARGLLRAYLRIVAALLCFTLMSVVSVAGLLYVLKGIPIGGVLSRALVAITLAAQEFRWANNQGALQQNNS